MTRKALPPYKCPRCGYATSSKYLMQRHFSTLNNPCPILVNDITLTQEVKDYIYANRVYRSDIVSKAAIMPVSAPVTHASVAALIPPPSQPEPPVFSETSIGYIYMIQEREFLQQKNPTFKIGCTVQEPDNQIKRLKAYKKGSKIVITIAVDRERVRSIETAIKSEFTNRFTKHSDGTEYFTGDEKEMRDIVIRQCT